MPFTQILPRAQLESSLQSVSESTPVASTMQRYLRLPPNNCIPAIEKIIMTMNKMQSESMTKEKELNRVFTIILRALTLVIVLSGLKTLMALRALTEKPILMMRGSKLVTTMTKSRIFHKSRR